MTMTKNHSASLYKSNIVSGIVFAILAGFILTAQDALIKHLSAFYPVLQILFVRSVVMLFPIIGLLAVSGRIKSLRTTRHVDHLIRMMLNLVTFFLFFWALSRLPLADTIALMLTGPVIMAFLSGPLLGEYVGGKQFRVILFAFVGVLFMVAPTGESVDWLAVSAVSLSAVGYSLMMIQTRRLSSTESSEMIVVYTAIGVVVLTGIMMLFWWTPIVEGSGWLLIALGCISAAGHVSLAKAFSLAPVYVVGPFDYTVLLWGILFGYLFWAELPTLYMLFGATLVILAGLLLYVEERRKALANSLAN